MMSPSWRLQRAKYPQSICQYDVLNITHGCNLGLCKCCHVDPTKSILLLYRNLSCGKKKERQAMRECPGLIDSLMSYVQSCVAEETPDEKVPCLVSITHDWS